MKINAGFTNQPVCSPWRDTFVSLGKQMAVQVDKIVDYTANVLLDIGRGVDYTSQWISDYSSFSPSTKAEARNVKSLVDRVNVVGVACESASAAKGLFFGQPSNAWEVVDAVGAYVSANSDLAGRLDDLKIMSLGAAKPFVGVAGALADSSLGLNGVREVLQEGILTSERPVAVSLATLAKNVALLAIGVFSGMAVYFSAIGVAAPLVSLGILTAASVYLGIKTGVRFYEMFAKSSLPAVETPSL